MVDKDVVPSKPRVAAGILAIILGASTVVAGNPAVGLATDDDNGSLPQGEHLEVPFIIEALDETIDVNSAATQAQFVQLLELSEPDAALQRGAGLSNAVTTGQISVDYIDSTPSDVRDIVDLAVADWNSVLDIPAHAPVVIRFRWVGMNTGILGGARPLDFFGRLSSLPTNDYYPSALANTLLNRDMSPNSDEIEISINSNLYGSSSGWHTGTGSVPANKIDLYSTLSHEIGHGLGFYGTATDSAQGPTLGGSIMSYDRLARYQNNPVVGSALQSSALVSNNLYINIGAERLYKLYAPNAFQTGSSFSHFAESYSTSAPGAMMTPALGRGELNRTIDAPILGVMSGIGWPMTAPALTPSLGTSSASSNQLTTSWTVDLGDEGIPPISFRIDARRAGATVGSTTVSGNQTSGSVSGLANANDHELIVTAIAANGAQAPASINTVNHAFTLMDAPYLLQASGSGLNRSLSWMPIPWPGASGATYTVKRSKDGGPFTTIGTTSGTTLADNTLSPGVFQYSVSGASNGAEARSLFVGVTTTNVRPFSLDGQVARLYEAYLGRSPDSSGMSFWLNERAKGLSLEAMSDQFAAGQEFQATFGLLDDEAFVHLVYNDVIGRQADAAGFAFWVSQLRAGMTRGQLMVEFSEASEYITKTGTVPPETSVEAEVYRLYVAYFLRAPDSSGFSYWVGQANAGLSIEAISAQFAEGTEFQARYGSLSNSDFVELIYRNVLTREAEGSGRTYWIQQLTAAVSRGDVMVGFSNSQEFVLATGTLPS